MVSTLVLAGFGVLPPNAMECVKRCATLFRNLFVVLAYDVGNDSIALDLLARRRRSQRPFYVRGLRRTVLLQHDPQDRTFFCRRFGGTRGGQRAINGPMRGPRWQFSTFLLVHLDVCSKRVQE